MRENIIAELNAEYETLTRVEKRIADYLLSTPKSFINSSITELSERLGVSQGSINNFGKKFSSGGFSALKLELAQSISTQGEPPFSAIDRNGTVKNALSVKLHESISSFKNTIDINSEESLALAVDMILSAKKIEVYGIYRSGIVAKEICYQLIQLGIPATFVTDSLMCPVSASMLNKDSLVIAASVSGRTKEIIESAELAKQSGAKVLCLVGSRTSPLVKVADCALITPPSGIAISDRSTEMHMSQFFVFDALCSYIRSITDSDGQKQFYKLQKLIGSHSID